MEKTEMNTPTPVSIMEGVPPLSSLVASARAMIEGLDSEGYISPETCHLINEFDRKLEAAFPSIAPVGGSE